MEGRRDGGNRCRQRDGRSTRHNLYIFSLWCLGLFCFCLPSNLLCECEPGPVKNSTRDVRRSVGHTSTGCHACATNEYPLASPLSSSFFHCRGSLMRVLENYFGSVRRTAAKTTICLYCMVTNLTFLLCHSKYGRYEGGDFSEPSGLEGPSQYESFCRITDLFVRAGSREEVNIRCVGVRIPKEVYACAESLEIRTNIRCRECTGQDRRQYGSM